MIPCSDKKKKEKANKLAGRAIKNGKIKKATACFVCGKRNIETHGHHEDYDKPLDVIFLCSRCHYNCHRGKSVYADMVRVFLEMYNPYLRKEMPGRRALSGIRFLVRKAQRKPKDIKQEERWKGRRICELCGYWDRRSIYCSFHEEFTCPEKSCEDFDLNDKLIKKMREQKIEEMITDLADKMGIDNVIKTGGGKVKNDTEK